MCSICFLSYQTKFAHRYRRVFDTGKILYNRRSQYDRGKENYLTETRKIPIFEGERVIRVITVVQTITERKKGWRRGTKINRNCFWNKHWDLPRRYFQQFQLPCSTRTRKAGIWGRTVLFPRIMGVTPEEMKGKTVFRTLAYWTCENLWRQLIWGVDEQL